jgi:hypothetical protein
MGYEIKFEGKTRQVEGLVVEVSTELRFRRVGRVVCAAASAVISAKPQSPPRLYQNLLHTDLTAEDTRALAHAMLSMWEKFYEHHGEQLQAWARAAREAAST